MNKNKKNVLPLALSLVALALSHEVGAHTSRVPNDHEQHRVENSARRRPAKRRKSAQTREVMYTCPMHSDVHLKSPGECPKCGMELEPEKPGKVKSE